MWHLRPVKQSLKVLVWKEIQHVMLSSHKSVIIVVKSPRNTDPLFFFLPCLFTNILSHLILVWNSPGKLVLVFFSVLWFNIKHFVPSCRCGCQLKGKKVLLAPLKYLKKLLWYSKYDGSSHFRSVVKDPTIPLLLWPLH